jgi:transglutaminase superfamily protein
MHILFLEAYWNLIRFDFYLFRSKFSPLYEEVRRFPISNQAPVPGLLERVCRAVDFACICYWKEVLCLQRSAATTCLLRKSGVAAHLVVGARQMPFKAHAWVEVGGKVVNDKPYVGELYQVLDRC